MIDIKPLLQSLGLDEKEVVTYLACLELGESAVVPIVKKTKIIRTTLLYVLEKLNEKGLIEIVQHATRRRYLPLPPRSLLALVRQKEAGLREQAELLEVAMPELNQLYATHPFQPTIRVYKDKELRDLYESILNQPIDEMCYVGDTTNIIQAAGDQFIRSWTKRRAAKGIKAKAIRVLKGEQDIPEYTGQKEMLRTTRYAPAGFNSPAVILIYGDNVAVVTTAKESFGVVTTSRDYAESMRNWFKELWKISSER